MAQPEKPKTLLLRNMGLKDLILRRAKSGLTFILEPYRMIQFKLAKDEVFVGINWEKGEVVIDTGIE